MKKKKSQNNAIVNKRAKFDYDVSETLLAGIVLTGAETKSLRLGHGIIRGSFVTVKNSELWLNNMQINPLKTNLKDMPEDERTRPRKLLVTKKQLKQLAEAKHQGLSIMPIKILTKSRFIKIEVGIGKGKKKYDKREVIKKRDLSRAMQRGDQ